ncbi:hypothetical protein EV126DRAFT_464904 [Verticillium dahliae]|nr:hypothetical protein EV126DRAFT_464904 [Verticillium dahliae]
MMKNFSVAINCPLPAEISIKDVKRGIQRLSGTFMNGSSQPPTCYALLRIATEIHHRLASRWHGKGGGHCLFDWLQDSFAAGRFDEENSEKEIEEESEEESEREGEAQRVECCGNITHPTPNSLLPCDEGGRKRNGRARVTQSAWNALNHINAIFRCLEATLSTAVEESEEDREESEEDREESEEDREESEEETTLARFDPGRPFLRKKSFNLGGVSLFSLSKDTTHFVASRATYNKLPQAVLSYFHKVSFVNHGWLDACSQQGSLVHVGPYIHDRLDEEESEESEEVDREEDEDKSEESEEEDREEDEDESEEEDNTSYFPREWRS